MAMESFVAKNYKLEYNRQRLRADLMTAKGMVIIVLRSRRGNTGA